MTILKELRRRRKVQDIFPLWNPMIFISSIEIGIYTSKFLLLNYRNRDVYSTQAVGMYGIIIFLDLFFDKAIVFIF